MKLSKWRSADYSAEIFWRLRDGMRSFLHAFYTCVCRIWLTMQGVRLGKSVSFNGHIHVERFKHSVIEIGNGCTFNSNISFNQLINQQTIVRTSNANAVIKIGNNSGFSGVRILSDKYIHIGNNVTIGANSIIRDGDDHTEILHTEPQEIIIEDKVFIGMNCIILKGVHIGVGAIIAAGSLVNKDIPAGMLAGGVPCRVVKELV